MTFPQGSAFPNGSLTTTLMPPTATPTDQPIMESSRSTAAGGATMAIHKQPMPVESAAQVSDDLLNSNRNT